MIDAENTIYSLAGKRVWVAGHRGMAGSALVRRLGRENCTVLVADRGRVDLCNQAHVTSWMAEAKPEVVFMAAGRVGGIIANNTLRAQFLYDNLMMAANVIHGSYEAGVEKLLYLGSTCIYPKLAPQPMPESSLLTGPLEPTNEPYAIAKIAGLKMIEAYRDQYGCDYLSVMPTNLYGPGDNYHPEHSHVFAALIQRFHKARLSGAESVVVWGTGTPRREFLHVEDFADACIHVVTRYSGPHFFNVGIGSDISIAELAHLIAEAVGYRGQIVFDPTKPDGTPRKLVDVSRLAALGWRPKIALKEGIAMAYADYLESGIARHDG